MRDYISDESYDEDEESEENDEVEEDEDEKICVKKRNLGRKRGDKAFDEDGFDRKVAIEVTKIHKKVRGDDKFSIWVEKNYHHLQQLYSLSNLECSPVDFFSYVYQNSSRK
jgi:hypothetical protein